MANNLFELSAQIKLDSKDYEKGINSAKGGMEKLSSWTIAKGALIADGVKEAGKALINVGKQSVESYGEYEQLIGGVETLFGEGYRNVADYAAKTGSSIEESIKKIPPISEDAYRTVLTNADNAFETAGMSANEYMTTVTSFSASLLQSLNGDTMKAANMADMAVRDMSDNANKMGSNLSDIEHAYQGFAKQNYTMLDNLKLGYGGTKTEMERLVADAAKLTDVQDELGVSVDANSLSYGNVVNAIHVVQSEMGILGTTEAEAATTIEGSINMAKGAWENLLTGLPDRQADVTELLNDFVYSVQTVAQNILPVVGQLLQSIVGLIANSLPELLESGVNLITKLADGIIQAIPKVQEAVPQVITSAVELISQNAQTLLDKGIELIAALADGIIKGIPKVMEAIPKVLSNIIDFISKNLGKILDKGVELAARFADGIVRGIPKLVAQLPKLITSIVNFITNNLPKIVDIGIRIIVTLGVGMIKAIPQLIKSIPQIVKAIVNGFTSMQNSFNNIGQNIVKGVWNGISSLGGWIGRKAKGFFKGIGTAAKNALGIHSPSRVFAEIGGYMVKGVAVGWDAKYRTLKIQIGNDMKALGEKVVVPAVRKINEEIVWQARPGHTMPTVNRDLALQAQEAVRRRHSTPTVNHDLALKAQEAVRKRNGLVNLDLAKQAQDAVRARKGLVNLDLAKEAQEALKKRRKHEEIEQKKLAIRAEEALKKQEEIRRKNTPYGIEGAKYAIKPYEYTGPSITSNTPKRGGYAPSVGYKHETVGSLRAKEQDHLEKNVTIVVKPVLDGKVIGESTYKYMKNKERAMGYA